MVLSVDWKHFQRQQMAYGQAGQTDGNQYFGNYYDFLAKDFNFEKLLLVFKYSTDRFYCDAKYSCTQGITNIM